MTGAQHFITAKFAYGPVDMTSLKREKVFLCKQSRLKVNFINLRAVAQWYSQRTSVLEVAGSILALVVV